MIRYFNKNDIKDIEKIFALYITRPEQFEHAINYLNDVLNKEEKAVNSDLRYLVADNNKEISGVLGFRKALNDMADFAETENPVELYSLFVKNKNHGVGKDLIKEMIRIVKELGYTEVIVFSAAKWEDSWNFYDKLGFKRIKKVEVLNEKPAQIWRMRLE